MDQQPAVKSSPRDVFLYLFATVALYFSIWSLVDILLQYINVAFPDVAIDQYASPGNMIRRDMAFLIIIFPAYIWVSRLLRKDLMLAPEKSEMRVRKWLFYLTLFLSALLVIGDLIALVLNFLEGELTIRFLFKVSAIFAVAGSVFWYYLYDLRAKATPLSLKALLFVRGVVGVVGALIVAGFFIAGSPFTQRLVRLDNTRTGDLNNLQWQIIQYWQQKDKLPQALGELENDISGYRVPVDPETSKSYEYRVTGDQSFELCADFDLSSAAIPNTEKPQLPEAAKGANWDHDKGRTCFNRTIDPDLFPPGKSFIVR